MNDTFFTTVFLVYNDNLNLPNNCLYIIYTRQVFKVDINRKREKYKNIISENGKRLKMIL